ncbi:hypothetical protein JX580_00425 [Thiomicrospira microaerophila]|uniref:beta strand repeat-containing protein n=1 Tax=Thiomicrospira microaerophila TaxID=406020 RepID=UPI0020104D96|nr:hypothetical protein [Thiomicrospira microaerophila]UQB42415.1 hypothetical protein JX580_00425 [Thiomicrospira microaerophila]
MSQLQNFINAFNDTYANQATTNEQLVRDMFAQVWGQTSPSADFVAWWVGKIADGTFARTEIAEKSIGFVQSGNVAAGENAAALLTTLQTAVGEMADADTGATQGGTTLTVMQDNLIGTDGDDVFMAPVVQNATGAGVLANTFETGDVIDGNGGINTLKATLIGTGTVADGINAAPIMATTTNVQNVFFQAQMPNFVNTIDAQNMQGVEQWWSDNSRSNITIEDIRSNTQETTFGMLSTDPGVAFNNFFNAMYLEGQMDTTDSAFTFRIREEGDFGAQIANINVIGIRFDYEGTTYNLQSDDVEAANTWVELRDALQAVIDATEGLETLTVTHNGTGNFTVSDSASGDFNINPSGTVITSSTTNEEKFAALGLPATIEGPTITNLVLDNAGNGSQGGAFNVGAMSGLRGMEELDITVNRDSHLTSITSFNQVPGQYNNLRDGSINEFLEVVRLESTGANGDLEIGRTTANLDGRVATWADNGTGAVVGAIAGVAVNSGFVNLVEFDGSNFQGAINTAITLDDNAIGRYLDSATEVVNFNYTTGSQNDILNIVDLSTGSAVSADRDFGMNIDLGAGDDRLIINVANVNSTSVDGGTGANSIVVAQSHGTAVNNTFASFANFQTYEVEGTGNNVVNNTQHNFNSMAGITNVIIATDGNTAVAGLPTAGDNTQLINLAAAQDVTVSGKNQTIGNNSTNDQLFGTVQLTNDAGANRTVTLDNTARLSNEANGVKTTGVLSVNNLLIDGASATRTVTIDSDGDRNTGNLVAAFNGRDVNTLNLVGTQDLTFNVVTMSNEAAAAGVTASSALNISGAGMTGADLNLAVAGGMIGNWGTAVGQVDRIVGTNGNNDTLMLTGVQGNSAVNVTGFETIQFGSAQNILGNNTMFGDWSTVQNASGAFNAQSVSANNFVITDSTAGAVALTLNNLGAGVTVSMGDQNRDANGNVVNSQLMNDNITLNSGAAAGVPASAINIDYTSVLLGGQAHNLTVSGYQSVGINLAHAGNLTGGALAADNKTLNLTLDGDARVLEFTGGLNHFANTGTYDTLTLGAALDNSLTTINFANYVGQIGAITTAVAAAGASNTTIVLNGYAANINDAAVAAEITTFRFTQDAVAVTEDWVITGFRGFNTAPIDLTNLSVLDLRDLGVQGLAEINIAQVGADTVITSNTGMNFEIQLVGVTAATDLSNENFTFAS